MLKILSTFAKTATLSLLLLPIVVGAQTYEDPSAELLPGNPTTATNPALIAGQNPTEGQPGFIGPQRQPATASTLPPYAPAESAPTTITYTAPAAEVGPTSAAAGTPTMLSPAEREMLERQAIEEVAASSGGDSQYKLLETVDGGEITAGGSTDLKRYLGAAFNWLLGLIAVIAILILIMSGITYTAAGVTETRLNLAKAQFSSVMWAVGIALGAWLILNFINPQILQDKFNLIGLGPGTGGSPSGGGEGGGSGGAGGGGGRSLPQNYPTGGNRRPDESRADAILRNAEESVSRLSTCSIDGTNNGNDGCAAAVNIVVGNATGEDLGGDLGVNQTVSYLTTHPEHYVPVPINQAGPGDIIAATEGERRHIGIVGAGGKIYSNSSADYRQGTFSQNYTLSSWRNYFSGSTNVVYRPVN